MCVCMRGVQSQSYTVDEFGQNFLKSNCKVSKKFNYSTIKKAFKYENSTYNDTKSIMFRGTRLGYSRLAITYSLGQNSGLRRK
jgi:hypothetical protein